MITQKFSFIKLYLIAEQLNSSAAQLLYLLIAAEFKINFLIFLILI